DLDAYFPQPGRVASLPSYPWQRQRHWNGEPGWWLQNSIGAAAAPTHPLLGSRVPGPDPLWHGRLEPARCAWLPDHSVAGAVVVPAAAYLDMLLTAARSTWDEAVQVRSVDVHRALTLAWEDPRLAAELHTSVSLPDGTTRISSREDADGQWRLHAAGLVARLQADPPPALDVAALRDRTGEPMDSAAFYDTVCASVDMNYGPAFQTLRQVSLGEDEALASYSCDLPAQGSQIHPTLLDGVLQTVIALLYGRADDCPYLPASFEAVRLWRTPSARGYAHARIRSFSTRTVVFDVTVADEDGSVSAQIEGCEVRRYGAGRPPLQHQSTMLRAASQPVVAVDRAQLPAPSALVEACTSDLDEIAGGFARNRYADYEPLVKRLIAQAVVRTFGELLPDRDAWRLGDLIGVTASPHHAPLTRLLADIAVRHGALRASGDGEDRTYRPAGPDEFASVLERVVRDFPAMSTELRLGLQCFDNLADILRGVRDPMELMFSDTERLAEQVYFASPVAQYHNRLARRLLDGMLASWPHDRPLRILEVGAGTGGTTAWLLPLLPAERTHYCYTDLSGAFFPRAATRFGAYPFVDYRPLDLDRDPAEQGFADASFDIVVASNVLHATRDLSQTLGRVTRLLADDGCMLAVESHDPELIATTFGLLEGLWSFTDTQLRDTALLPRRRWPSLLRSCGFADAVSVADDSSPAGEDGSVLLAQRAPRTAPVPPPDAAPKTPRRWILTGESQELSGPLTEALRAHGCAVTAHTVTEDPQQWTEAMSAAAGEGAGPFGIVLLIDPEDAVDDTVSQTVEGVVRQAAVLRSVTGVPGDAEAVLYLVVRSRDAAPESVPSTVAGGAAWGQARSLAQEHTTLPMRRIAVCAPEGRGGETAPRLAAELLCESGEDEVTLTSAGRFIPRLVDNPPPRTADADAPCVLQAATTGLTPRLAWRPASERRPGPGEVAVDVRAAGLNYRDILVAAGLVPPARRDIGTGEPMLGLECAGTIAETGPGVSGLAPGRPVMAMAAGSLASRVTIDAAMAIPMPEGMDFTAAAALPVTALTVTYALEQLAHLAPGETVLIHSAAGGVGLAAVQYARHVGAEVIATAGTASKRRLLRLLGCRHVLDSRSLAFPEEVRELTAGRGVDVVLNSLAGEAMARSLELLAPRGRFVELGKRDILDGNVLSLGAFRDDTAFFGADLTAMFSGGPGAAELLARAGRHIREGVFQTPPHAVHPAELADEAIETLRRSRHFGKLVVEFTPGRRIGVEPFTRRLSLDPNATYLVTGGLGGFGAATAGWLAERGARRLALIGRRGAESPEAPALLRRLADGGVDVDVYAADAADVDVLARLLAAADAAGRPVRGVVHTAAVYDNGPAQQLTDERFRSVVVPKLGGALALDAALGDRELDFFVVYSSSASVIGGTNQGSYNASNLAAEVVARRRRRRGQPATAVQWGMIADTGYVVRANYFDTLEREGLGPVSSTEACSALEGLLVRPYPDPAVLVGRFDWDRARMVFPIVDRPRFEEVLTVGAAGEQQSPQLLQTLSSGSDEEALDAAQEAIVGVLASILQTAPDRIDPVRPLDQTGMDSLMATEFAVALQRQFDLAVPALELAAGPSVRDLSARLVALARKR
ncbi:MAG: SDR family NAD(P)-dependent oxidoreductase, partial [Stackebrandtia sp.]